MMSNSLNLDDIEFIIKNDVAADIGYGFMRPQIIVEIYWLHCPDSERAELNELLKDTKYSYLLTNNK